ncbi:MAG TPA: GspE/PulE family protein [Candidatus Babeliales bacterium]|nr:GspE/PulE family protein [Candidatus Babeliales bacterium]
MSNKADVIDDQSIVSRVQALLDDAIKHRASDIHLEPTRDELRVRFRIDGILIDQRSFSAQLSSAIIARLKILASLSSTERRIPQDGKFHVMHEGNEIDVRVSTFPCLYGEKMVVRILNRALQTITLESLGFEPTMLTRFKQLLERHSGFFLVTGPTGSGKTTTLYAALSFLHSSERNIVTLEDPVEYSLHGITQAQINVPAGFTFEKGIRSLVRQDPDIIMVGEIRDKITARIAIEAALTGHLVLSTLHTADAPSAIMRLMDMGIEPFLLNAALSGILAQRLVRKLCVDCRTSRAATVEEKKLLKKLGIDSNTVYESSGCAACDNLGYKGRVGIFELLEISPALRALIIANPQFADIYNQALADGMQILQEDGAHKVKEGIISLAEYARVIL